MLIEEILKSKGRDVFTVHSQETLRMAAQYLDEHRVGAVVALGTGDTLIGVLSERDIVRQVAREGAGALDMPVSVAMTRDVITATPGETLDTCLERMTDRRIRHLPVVRDGRMVGLVSIGDLVKWKIRETEAEAESLKSYLTN